jgi:hypothetical protein
LCFFVISTLFFLFLFSFFFFWLVVGWLVFRAQGEAPLQSAKKRNVLLAAADYIRQLEGEEAVLIREKERLRAANEQLRTATATPPAAAAAVATALTTSNLTLGVAGGLLPAPVFEADTSFGSLSAKF